jgi:hypothetical protein
VRTAQQTERAAELATLLNIDARRILFFEDRPDEPWLSPEALNTIARRSDRYKELHETFQEFIAPLGQVAHQATFVDVDGKVYGRSGVATVDDSAEIDPHTVAAGRAISAALTAGGINPLRPGAAVDLGELKLSARTEAAAEKQTRRSDIARIHILAKRKGLIVESEVTPGKEDRTKYKQFISDRFNGATTSTELSQLQRASLIEAMERLEDVDEFADIDETERAVA